MWIISVEESWHWFTLMGNTRTNTMSPLNTRKHQRHCVVHYCSLNKFDAFTLFALWILISTQLSVTLFFIHFNASLNANWWQSISYNLSMLTYLSWVRVSCIFNLHILLRITARWYINLFPTEITRNQFA